VLVHGRFLFTDSPKVGASHEVGHDPTGGDQRFRSARKRRPDHEAAVTVKPQPIPWSAIPAARSSVAATRRAWSRELAGERRRRYPAAGRTRTDAAAKPPGRHMPLHTSI
jgi:hypothetical protein